MGTAITLAGQSFPANQSAQDVSGALSAVFTRPDLGAAARASRTGCRAPDTPGAPSVGSPPVGRSDRRIVLSLAARNLARKAPGINLQSAYDQPIQALRKTSPQNRACDTRGRQATQPATLACPSGRNALMEPRLSWHLNDNLAVHMSGFDQTMRVYGVGQIEYLLDDKTHLAFID